MVTKTAVKTMKSKVPVKAVTKRPAAKAGISAGKKVSAPVAKAKPAATAGKKVSLEGLTGLALHRAKASNAKLAGGTVKGKAKPAAKKTGRAALPIFKAPADFKPFFLEVFLRTEKDGLLSSMIKATRYQGRYDPEAEDKKKADLGSYDQPTLMGILSRFSGVTYGTNMTRRLPPNTTYRALLRVNKKAADDSLSVLFKGVAVGAKNGKGRVVYDDLEKQDPNYRKLRKASRLLPAAFKAVLMPPKKVRGKKVEAEEDEE